MRNITAMRETFTLVEQRVISGRGVLKLPTDVDYRHFRVWVQVFRLPTVNYVNNRYNPSQGQYANISYMAESYVYEDHQLDYQQQVYDIPIVEPAAFLIDSLVCNFKAIEEVLCIILPLVGGPPCVPGATDFLDAVKVPIDELLFVCRDDTAIQVTLYGLKFDVTCPEGAPTPKLPGGAPVPASPVSPGTPVDTSPPYVAPDDGGNTVPNGQDSSDECADVGLWVITYSTSSGTFAAYHPAKANDVVELQFNPFPGCTPNPSQVYTNGVQSYAPFGCINQVLGWSVQYLGKSVVPPGEVYLPSEVYPNCDGS